MAKERAKNTPKKRLPVLVVSAEERTQVGCLTCALCCTYVAVEISEPSSVKTATEILWHLYHDQVSVYRDANDDWLVQFETRCRNLKDDNKCAIYETRPHICREYSEESCEVNADDEGQTFYTPAAFLEYLKGRSTRIYRGVEKSYMPGPEHLGKYKAQGKKALPSFQSRYTRLRALGAPREV